MKEKINIWLERPYGRQIVFLAVCGILSVVVEVGPYSRLGAFLELHPFGELFGPGRDDLRFSILSESLMDFLVFVFIGLVLVGRYDKLWMPAAGGVLLDAVLVLLGRDVHMLLYEGLFRYLLVVSILTTTHLKYSDVPFLILGMFSVVLWAVPHRIAVLRRELADKDPAVAAHVPGYKLSGFLRGFWRMFWGFVILHNAYYLWVGLLNVDWSDVHSSFFSIRNNYVFGNIGSESSTLWIDLIPYIFWSLTALFLLADSYRKDARAFHTGVAIITVWQAIKLWFFHIGTYTNTYPDAIPEVFHGFPEKWYLALLLLGSAILLRAAWNRPPPEALEEV